MKCLRYEENGVPWEVVRLVDAETPTLEVGSVLVAVEGSPIHIADLKAIRGELAFIAPGAGTPGFEGVGRIVACADDVTGWSLGDRVILPLRYGAWCEIVCARADAIWRAPPEGSVDQLALVRINLTTAYLLLHAYRPLAREDWIIQNAANSNVGGYVDQLAEALGVNVINVVRRRELVTQLQAAGRRNVVLDGEDLAEMAATISQVRPCLALDAIGGAATARLGNCVADKGLVLAYGFLAEEAYRLDYPDVMFRNVGLTGMMTDRAEALLGEAGRETMRSRLEALMQSASLTAEIAATYAFDQASDALRHAQETGAGRTGKVILVPSLQRGD